MISTNASPTGGLLPHHLSQSTFRFYEPYLTLAVRNFPEETSWDVLDVARNNPKIRISPTTFAARFRDAIVSLTRFHWETTVDVAKLVEMRAANNYAIAQQSGTSIVWFRNRANKGRPSAYVAEARDDLSRQASPSGPVLWRDATARDLDALCYLLGSARLSGIYLLDKQLQNDIVDALTTMYNVSITWDDEQKRTVIT